MIEVSVRPKSEKFPSTCSNCLVETDLTTYALKWKKDKEEYRVDVPICKSCKKTRLRETRKKFAIYFAIAAPIFWSLAYFLDYLPQISWYGLINAIVEASANIIVRVILIVILLILLLPVLIPLFLLYSAISPSGEANWPVKKVKSNDLSNVFSFENIPYARLFVAANPSSTPPLEDLPLSLLDLHTKRLQHKDWTVRNEATMTLGNLKDPRTINPLIQAINDESDAVRISAARALGDIGGPRALEALTQAKEDKSRWVRRAARQALKELNKSETSNKP
ncbi:MAG: HEAT repeat domain-containing protein [Candidatus Bathyarchaeum sp.]|nr:MAG: HEAT repeat domain-containing protein [Candidatus Bathyarchaeum sp.]